MCAEIVYSENPENEAPRASSWYSLYTVAQKGAPVERNPAPEDPTSIGKPVIFWGVEKNDGESH